MAEIRTTKAGALALVSGDDIRVTKAGVLVVVAQKSVRTTKAGALVLGSAPHLRLTKVGALVIAERPTPLIEPVRSIEIELWSDYLAAGGDRIAILSDHESILRGSYYRRQMDRDEELVLVLSSELTPQVSLVTSDITFRSANTNETPSGTTLDVSLTNVEVGDFLLGQFRSRNAPDTAAMAASGWTHIATIDPTENGIRAHSLWWRIAPVAGAQQHTFTQLTPSTGFMAAGVSVWSGVDPAVFAAQGLPFAAQPVDNTLIDAPSATPVRVGSRILRLWGASRALVEEPPGPFALEIEPLEGETIRYQHVTPVAAGRQVITLADVPAVGLDPSGISTARTENSADDTVQTSTATRRNAFTLIFAPRILTVSTTGANKIDEIQLGRVIRASDGIHAPTWWRLARREEGRGIGTGTVRLTGVSPHEELGRALLRTTAIGGSTRFNVAAELTPVEWIDQFILPALQAEGIYWIVRGDVEFDQPLRYELSEGTPLLLMNQIEADTGGEWRLEEGATLELSVFVLTLRRRIGDNVPERLMMFGRNVLHLERDVEHGQAYGTVVVPTGRVSETDGTPATIAEAVWQVTGLPAADTIDVAAPQGQLFTDPPEESVVSGFLLGLPPQMTAGTSVQVSAELRDESGTVEGYDPAKWAKTVVSGDATFGGPNGDLLTMGETPGAISIQLLHETGVPAGGTTVLIATSGSFVAELYGLPAQVIEDEDYEVHARKRDAVSLVIVQDPAPATFAVPSGPASITGGNIVSVNPNSAPAQITVLTTLQTPEMEQDSATATVVEGPELPPIPPPNPGNYSVILQPAGGHNVIANFNGSTKIWPGWTLGAEWLNNNRVRVVDDSAAKFEKAIEKRFFQGEPAGGFKGNARRNIGLWRELYVRMVLAYSATWVWHSGGGKFIYLHNSGTGAAQRNFVLQGAAGGAGGQLPTGGGRVPCIVDFGSGIGQWVPFNTPALARGVYHTIEYLINVDIGDSGGSLRMAIDGVPVSQYFLVGAGTISALTNVNWKFNDNVTDKRVGALAEAFLYWGGSNQNVPADMYIRLSELYMSGKN